MVRPGIIENITCTARYVIQYRHPKQGWIVFESNSKRKTRWQLARVTRRGWMRGSNFIMDRLTGHWTA